MAGPLVLFPSYHFAITLSFTKIWLSLPASQCVVSVSARAYSVLANPTQCSVCCDQRRLRTRVSTGGHFSASSKAVQNTRISAGPLSGTLCAGDGIGRNHASGIY